MDTLFFLNYNQFPWINDVSTILMPSLLLLWASKRVRTQIQRCFFYNYGWKKVQIKSNIIRSRFSQAIQAG